MLQRPNENEFPAYYQPYIQLVPEGDLLQVLKEDLQETITLFEGISEEDSYFRYDENKWSIKEVLCHVTDTERIMSYRLLRVGRGDETTLAGFNENDYIKGAQIERLPLKNILDDFIATRNATISLIQNMQETVWENKGFANKMPITTRAIAYIIAGHAIHHKKIVTERYLTALK
ncbi:DinB family protein [Neobacillus niacini]|uniref:DinB family protein n=1 Tax=Neobacillus niacini TaxID=86668 RepID=UPI0028583866|nr:DinB family protein [Neobacillus niacini]MDR6999965.1 putative damage-inducible protein DinB [Neobacillus niacini]